MADAWRAVQMAHTVACAGPAAELQAEAQKMRREGVRQLHAALHAERLGLQWFLDAIQTQVLTPLQEAWLEAVSPLQRWIPDWWAMSNALAALHNQPQVLPCTECTSGIK